MPTLASLLTFSDEVRGAQSAERQIVALESTLIAHGLPWPVNLETARETESSVREAGAVPATIAVIDGVIRVGLEPHELERLARGSDVHKASPRDLPWLVATRRTGATTVAGTLFVAHHAGIPIMATGGIGGVHRGADETWDVSADLEQLAHTPVAVVSSGIKSILDLPRSLEYLETRGVLVLGYQTDELPAFLAASSGLRLENRVDTPSAAAAVIQSGLNLLIPSGVLIVQKPPAPFAMPADELDALTRGALEDAARFGVCGKAVTPYLLDRLRAASGGRVLAANRALVVENARLAAAVACALAARDSAQAVAKEM